MSRAVRRPLPVVLAAVALLATSCGGGSEETTAGQAAKPAAPATTPAGEAGAGTSGTTGAAGGQAAPSVPQPVPAPGDLVNFSCTRRGGVWSARGDVTSSASEPMVYSLTVVTVDGAEVSGREGRRFVLGPDQSTSFRLPGIARGPADTCMPRLLRTPR